MEFQGTYGKTTMRKILTIAAREYKAMVGTKAFVARCRKLAKTHGPRFAPSKLLVEMAANGDAFYRRFAPDEAKRAA